jgi:hypothetical protein
MLVSALLHIGLSGVAREMHRKHLRKELEKILFEEPDVQALFDLGDVAQRQKEFFSRAEQSWIPFISLYRLDLRQRLLSGS